MKLTEQERNRIRGLHRESSTVKSVLTEDGPKQKGVCKHGKSKYNESSKTCRTAQNKFAVIPCQSDEDCSGGGVYERVGNSPTATFQAGGCWCDLNALNVSATQQGTNTNTTLSSNPKNVGSVTTTGSEELGESRLNRIVKRAINESQLLTERIGCHVTDNPCATGNCLFDPGSNSMCCVKDIQYGCMKDEMNVTGGGDRDFGKDGENWVEDWDTLAGEVEFDGGKSVEDTDRGTRLNEQDGDWNAWLNADAAEQCRLCKTRYWTTADRNKYCRCSSCVCTTGQPDKTLLCRICKTIHWTTAKRNKHCRCRTCPCGTGVPTTTNLGVDKDFRGPSEFDDGGAQSHELNPGVVMPSGPGVITPYSKVDGVLQEEINRATEMMSVLVTENLPFPVDRWCTADGSREMEGREHMCDVVYNGSCPPGCQLSSTIPTDNPTDNPNIEPMGDSVGFDYRKNEDNLKDFY